jgi:hypothetical protein
MQNRSSMQLLYDRSLFPIVSQYFTDMFYYIKIDPIVEEVHHGECLCETKTMRDSMER